MALICKAAGQCHIQQRQLMIAQPLLGQLDATGEKPLVRRHSHGAPKRAREMAHGQAALPSHLLQRYTTIEIGAENFFGAPHLPWREATPDRSRQRSHAAISLSNMYPKRQEYVVYEQLARLAGRLSAGSAAHPRPEIVLSSIPAGLWFRSPIRGASASSAIAFSEPRGR
jgi:hypothetical protein